MGTNRGHDAEATEFVSMWIANDGDYYHTALGLAGEKGDDLTEFAEFLTRTLNEAREHSAAWYTRRDLSASEMDAIDWEEVAEAIREE